MQFAWTRATPWPSFNLTLSSVANAAVITVAHATPIRTLRIAPPASNDFDHQPLYHVVVVSGRVMNELHRLAIAARVVRTRHDEHHAILLGAEGVAEAPKSETSI